MLREETAVETVVERLRSLGVPDMALEPVERWLAEQKAEAWREGHYAGRDYQGDGWNSDMHDPERDNLYAAPPEPEPVTEGEGSGAA